MTQKPLIFDALLAREAVRNVLSKNWLANHELPNAVFQLTGEWYSETGLSARVRELRNTKYGALHVAKRKREGKSYFEYSVVA